MSYSLERERRGYAKRRPKQRKLYLAYKSAGVCWKCKVGDVANPGGAWCQGCIENARLARKQ